MNWFYIFYTIIFEKNLYKYKIWQVHIAQSFRNKYVFLKGLLSNCWKNNSHHFSWHCSRRFVYCVWLCFGNIMSVATINNVHSHKFQWNFFFWRKWVVVDNIILIKIFWVIPILSSKIDSKLLLADMIFGGFERSLVSENDFSNVFVNMS